MGRRVIQIRVSEEDDARLRAAARAAGCTLTDFIVNAALAESATTVSVATMSADSKARWSAAASLAGLSLLPPEAIEPHDQDDGPIYPPLPVGGTDDAVMTQDVMTNDYGERHDAADSPVVMTPDPPPVMTSKRHDTPSRQCFQCQRRQRVGQPPLRKCPECAALK